MIGAIQFTSEGDAILITAVLDDPQRAADLANAWAEEASTTINLVYSGEQPLSVIKEQQSVARTAYEAAQELLERFLSDNRILLLENRLLEESEIVGILTSNRSNLVAYFENRQRELNTFIVEAEALKRQVETGSRSTAGSVGDSLTVLFSRASAMGILTEQQTSKMTPEGVPTISSNPVHGFTLDLSQLELLEGSTADLAFDLDTLIEEAKRELELAEESLINLVNDPQESEDGEILETSSANIQSIQTALENQKARLLELTSERDTAWEAYYALTQKEIELINSSQTTDIVTLVAPAVPPAESLANSTAINVVAAAGFGLILGVFVVLGRTWWKGSN